MDDVLLNKATTIERCLARITEEYVGHESEFATHLTRQDSIILNLQRACEAAIDAGMRIVRMKQLGVPQSSREIFSLLAQAGIISQSAAQPLEAMVSFRNIAVHDYQKMNIEIVRHILEDYLDDLASFAQLIVQL